MRSSLLSALVLLALCAGCTGCVGAAPSAMFRQLITPIGNPDLVTVTITAPTSAATYDAGSADTLTTLAGTATTNPALTNCRWENNQGGLSGATTGTASWSVGSIALTEGVNVITVSCTNAIGLTGVDTLTVTRTDTAENPIDPDRRTDWTIAGVRNGITHRTTQCGATINAYSGTAGTINTAISNCTEGQYVNLAAGTFTISTMIDFGTKNNVTLRGQGADQTIIVFGVGAAAGCGGPASLMCVEGPYIDVDTPAPGNVRNWTAGFAAGTDTITVAAVTNLQVNSMIILDQTNDSADNGDVFDSCDIEFSDEGGCSPQGGRGRARTHYAIVTAINGTDVTFTPPIPQAWSSGKSPQMIYESTLPRRGIGIEDMSLDGSAPSGYWGIITFFGAIDSWVRGVRIDDPQRAHILLYQSVHITMESNLLFTGQEVQSQSYGFESFGSSAALFHNNIVRDRTSPVSLNGPGCCHVIAHNYIDDIPWGSPTSYQPAGILFHEAALYHILVEGNSTPTMWHDDFHGQAYFATLFRNFMSSETTKDENTCEVQIQSYGRFFNVIGNVLGRPGYHDTYEPAGTTGGSDTNIYCFGVSPEVQVASDPQVKATIFRWGNYDVVNDADRFDSGEVPSSDPDYPQSVPPTQNLPASFYLTEKPSWFGANTWPAIGPDVIGGDITGYGGRAYRIPAKVCWDSLGQVNGSDFDAQACYGAP